MERGPDPGSSRRQFLNKLYAAAAVGLINPLKLLASIELDPRVAAIVASTIGIDAHNHVDVPTAENEVPGPDIDLPGDLKRSGLSAICMTFAVDYQKINDPSEGYIRFINALNSFDQHLQKNGMKRALSLADITLAHKNKQPIVIQSVEGGHFLEGKIDRVKEAYERGLRHLGLLHDNDASVPLGDIYTNEPKFGGLTPFGADIIRECNKRGILVDLTHASADTVKAALKISAKPMIFSHTGLDTQLGSNPSMANMMKPRLINASTAKAIADAGGVIGVWKHLTSSSLEFVQSIRSMVDAVGADHVCIGTDSKLMTGTNKIWADQTTGFYYTIVDAMLKNGFSETEIGKIGGGNFCRVFDKATAV
jgi:membrane dipeptidase